MPTRAIINRTIQPVSRQLPRFELLSARILLRLLVGSIAWLALTLVGCGGQDVQPVDAGIEDADVSLPIARGIVDETFGEGGVVLDQGASGGREHVYGYDIKVNFSGDYIVAGETFTEGGAQDVAIWHYYSDGTPNPSFGVNGLVVGHGFGGGLQDNAWDMILTPTDQIVIAGRTQDSGLEYNMLVCRYNPDGELDRNFNRTGCQVHNNAAGANHYDSGYAITLDSLGRAIVGGGSLGLSEGGDGIDGPINSDLAVWVFNQNGQFDQTFGSRRDGIFVHSDVLGVNAAERATCATTDSEGRLLFAGYGRNPEGLSDIPVWRLNSDGTLDETFNGDGYLVERNLAGVVNHDSAGAIAVDPSGKVWVVGITNNAAGNADMVILKYNDDGSRDLSFNETGLVVAGNIAGGESHDGASSLVFDANGNVVIGGGSIDAEGRGVVFLARYTLAGELDRSFGPNGTGVMTTGAEYSNECRLISLALDSNGIGLVGAGFCLNENNYYDMAIWRFR